MSQPSLSRALRACLVPVLALFLGLPGAAAAATDVACGQAYSVRPGDSLSRIALEAYDDYRKWTVIYNANLRTIGDDPNRIVAGASLRIPCLGTGASERTLPRATGKQVRILSGGNYAPFTNRDREDGGLVSELLNAALGRSDSEVIGSFGFAWEDDWSRHLDPLLSEGEYDLGYPWLKPDCKAHPGRYRCKNFLFSEPLFEMLVVLFVDADDPIRFERDSDLFARVLCRPAGYYTHDLEAGGRNWLSEKKVNLWQPDTLDECFRLLVDGGVDAVAVNEFTGRSAMHRLGLQDRVQILQGRPLSIEGLHVIAHRDHPRAAALVDAVDEAIAGIRRSGHYKTIVERHLSAYWSRF